MDLIHESKCYCMSYTNLSVSNLKKANFKAGHSSEDLHQMYIGAYKSQDTFCALVPLEGPPQMQK